MISYFGMYEEEQPKLCTGINVLQKLNGEGAWTRMSQQIHKPSH